MAPNPQRFAAIKRALRTADEAGIARSHARGMVKGLDMSPEGRMARARAMGFDTETPLYHGTTATNIEGFRQSRNGAMGPGVYTTTDPGTGSRYATERYVDGLPTVYPVIARGGNIASIDDLMLRNRQQMMWELSKEKPGPRPADLADDGFDGVQQDTYRTIFSPSNIRSPNATFDPARANRRDLLAATIPAAAIGAGALALQPDDAEAAPRMTPEQIAALKRSIKAQTVNDNRTDDLQSLRASLQGAQKGKPGLDVIPGGVAAAAIGTYAAARPDDAEAALIGPSARTWNAAKAARANAMLREGGDASRIWQETGTFHDVTGVPWQEVSDEGFSVDWGALGRTKGTPIPLRQAVKHPELEKAYPDMFDQGIYQGGERMPAWAGGIYDRGDKSIGVTEWARSNGGYLNKRGEFDGGEGIIAHEMAHAVQDREGLLNIRQGLDQQSVPFDERIDENLAEVQRRRMAYSDEKKAQRLPSADYTLPASQQHIPSVPIKQSAYFLPKVIDDKSGATCA